MDVFLIQGMKFCPHSVQIFIIFAACHIFESKLLFIFLKIVKFLIIIKNDTKTMNDSDFPHKHNIVWIHRYSQTSSTAFHTLWLCQLDAMPKLMIKIWHDYWTLFETSIRTEKLVYDYRVYEEWILNYHNTGLNIIRYYILI